MESIYPEYCEDRKCENERRIDDKTRTYLRNPEVTPAKRYISLIYDHTKSINLFYVQNMILHGSKSSSCSKSSLQKQHYTPPVNPVIFE